MCRNVNHLVRVADNHLGRILFACGLACRSMFCVSVSPFVLVVGDGCRWVLSTRPDGKSFRRHSQECWLMDEAVDGAATVMSLSGKI